MNIRTEHAASMFRVEVCGLWHAQYVYACRWLLEDTVGVEPVHISWEVFYLLTLLEADPTKSENHEEWLL